MSAAVRPVAVTDHQRSGVLEIGWSDGHTSRLPHALLRAQCRCAACQHHRRRTDEPAPAIAPTVRLTAIHPVSDQGLNLIFDDGHGRGIFPWPYLRELDAVAAAAADAPSPTHI